MGCTQSKSSTNAVISHGANSKGAATLKPALVEDVEVTISRTCTADDNDLATKVVIQPNDVTVEIAADSNKSTVLVVADAQTNLTNNKEGLLNDAPVVDGLANAATTKGEPKPSTTSTTSTGVVVALSPKSPRRRRQRSNSTGVKDMSMAALATEAATAVANEVKQESRLQPVVLPKKATTVNATTTPSSVGNTHDRDDKEGEKQLMVNLEPRIEPMVMTEEDVLCVEESSNKPGQVVNEETTFADAQQKTEVVVEEKLVESTLPKTTCAACNAVEANPGAFKFCAKCKQVSYCGRDCQKKHWKEEHKKVCCMNSDAMGASSSHLRESWSLTESASNASSSGTKNDTNNEDAGMEVVVEPEDNESYLHEDAVKELEACLARLRSEDADLDHRDAELEEDVEEEETKNVSIRDDEKPAALSALETKADPVEAAREETAFDSPTSATASDENLAPPATTGPPSSVAVQQQPPKCAACNSVEKAAGAFKSCAKCRDVYYCNKQCQKSHWKAHKKTCCKIDTSKRNLAETKDASLNPIQV